MLNRLKNSFAAVCLLNFVIAALFYLTSLHSKFVYDINMHFIAYEHYGIRGFWSCWGENTIRWGINCVNYAIWRAFGANDYVWFTVFIACHALVATLLYRLIGYLLTRIAFPHASTAAFLSMMLFLLSPYHTETIVWGATLFYITFTATFLVTILCFISYTESHQNKYIIIFYLLYFFELVTFEVFLISPFVFMILYFLMERTGGTSLSLKKFVRLFILPQFGFIGFYFLWNKLRIGQIVGHYGAATHFHFDIWMLSSNFTKYLLKFCYVHLFFSYAILGKINAHLSHHHFLLALLSVYLLMFASIVLLIVSRKLTPVWYTIIALLALFFITLVPVLNLYLPVCKDIEQERYLYVPALFFYSAFVITMFQIFRKGAYLFIALAMGISIFFLHRNVFYWEQDGKINNSLIADFRWPNAKRIFILLNGDDYQGAYMMRDMPESAFAEMLHVQRHIDIDQRSWDLLQFNVNSPSDSCTHEIVDSNTIRITLAQWGNWYWYKSYGASSYDSTLYKVTIDEWSHSFTAQFKHKEPGDVYIYQCRDKWKEIKGF